MEDDTGRQVHSYSRIKLWRFCRQAHWNRYKEKIEPVKTGKPLKMGSYLHELTALVSQGKSIQELMDSISSEYDKMFIEEKEFYGDMPSDLTRIMEGYKTAHGQEDQALNYTHIEAELGPVPLTKYTSLTIRPDRLVEDPTRGGRTFLFETKSGKSLPTEDFRLWDTQTFLYIWGMRELGMKIDGIVWDHVRSKPPTIPQILRKGGLSVAKSIDTTYDTYYQAVVDNDLLSEDYQAFMDTLRGRENKFFRRVRLPVKENMLKPIIEEAKITSLEIYLLGDMRPVKNVSRTTCSMCSFKSLCEAELLGLDVEYVKETQFRPKPPRPEETKA